MTQDLIVDSVRAETDRIKTITLRAENGSALPPHSAGAHLKFDLGALGTRSYSLIDWPGDPRPAPHWRIAVQCEESGQGGSMHMHALRPGDVLRAQSPANDFPLGDHDGPALLLAGGIGITPLISMATALSETGRAFALHYSARSRGGMGFADALSQVFGSHVTFHYDDETPLDLATLFAGIAPATHLYVCGPKSMIEAARAAANAAGMPDTQIHFELFTTPQPQEGDTAFEVEIASTGQVFTVPPGRSIIEVLEDGGLDLIYDCQRGDCGICQTEVLEGTPDHRDVVLSDAEKAEGKLMQICVSRAKSAKLILDL